MRDVRLIKRAMNERNDPLLVLSRLEVRVREKEEQFLELFGFGRRSTESEGDESAKGVRANGRVEGELRGRAFPRALPNELTTAE